MFPLTFVSSAFVPVQSMPSVLRAFADVNPFTIMVDAMRSLWLGTPAGNNMWEPLLWIVVIFAVFSPLAVARYRRAAGSLGSSRTSGPTHSSVGRPVPEIALR